MAELSKSRADGSNGKTISTIKVNGRELDRVRISAPGPSHFPGGGINTAEFKGRKFMAGSGEVVDVKSLGWETGDPVAAMNGVDVISPLNTTPNVRHGLIIQPPEWLDGGKATVEPPKSEFTEAKDSGR